MGYTAGGSSADGAAGSGGRGAGVNGERVADRSHGVLVGVDDLGVRVPQRVVAAVSLAQAGIPAGGSLCPGCVAPDEPDGDVPPPADDGE